MASYDLGYGRATAVDPIVSAAAVTPNDSTDLAILPRALFIGTGGDIKVTINGVDLTYKNIADGTTFPRRVSRVWSTGTTADDIIAEW